MGSLTKDDVMISGNIVSHKACGQVMTLYQSKENPKASEFYCEKCHKSILTKDLEGDNG